MPESRTDRFQSFVSSALLGSFLLFKRYKRRMGFWSTVALHADLAYEHFKADPAWQVFDSAPPEELAHDNNWIGPFKLTVPKLGGKTVTIFGRRKSCEDSEDALLELLPKD